MDVTPEYLRSRLDYDPETGRLTWRNGNFAGKPAFACPDMAGYLRGNVRGRRFSQHRVIWALHYGSWPDHEVDHINTIRSDNRIENLRAATRQANTWNRKAASGRSGLIGVSWHGNTGKWAARIMRHGRCLNLGLFVTKEDAANARQAAEARFGVNPEAVPVPPPNGRYERRSA